MNETEQSSVCFLLVIFLNEKESDILATSIIETVRQNLKKLEEIPPINFAGYGPKEGEKKKYFLVFNFGWELSSYGINAIEVEKIVRNAGWNILSESVSKKKLFQTPIEGKQFLILSLGYAWDLGGS